MKKLKQKPNKDEFKSEYLCGFIASGSWATRLEKYNSFLQTDMAKYILKLEQEERTDNKIVDLDIATVEALHDRLYENIIKDKNDLLLKRSRDLTQKLYKMISDKSADYKKDFFKFKVLYGNGEYDSFYCSFAQVIEHLKSDDRYHNYSHDGAKVYIVDEPVYTIRKEVVEKINYKFK